MYLFVAVKDKLAALEGEPQLIRAVLGRFDLEAAHVGLALMLGRVDADELCLPRVRHLATRDEGARGHGPLRGQEQERMAKHHGGRGDQDSLAVILENDIQRKEHRVEQRVRHSVQVRVRRKTHVERRLTHRRRVDELWSHRLARHPCKHGDTR